MAKEKTENTGTAGVMSPERAAEIRKEGSKETVTTRPSQPTRVRGQRLGFNEFLQREQQKGKTLEQINVSWELYCEPKSSKFRRLANARRNKAVQAILALIPLANTSQYEYNDVQAQILVRQLTDAVQRVRNSFAGVADQSELEQL